VISSIQNLIARRDLAAELIRTELKSRSAENRLGWLWWVLDPLLMIGVYWGFKVVVFGKGKYAPYPIFVGVALLAWRHLTTSTSRSVKALHSNEALIKAVPFPTAVLPLSQATSQFIYFCVSFAVLTVIAVVIGQPVTATMIQIPALAMLQLLLVTGLSLILACFGVLVRDLEIALGHALRIGWYLSPGIYGLDLVVNRFGSDPTAPIGKLLLTLYMANPFAILFVGYRGALFEPRWLEPIHWAVLGIESVTILLFGYWVFRRFDRRVIKFI
jgi:ABC-type polysaccharide/polyol phosphate export permease